MENFFSLSAINETFIPFSASVHKANFQICEVFLVHPVLTFNAVHIFYHGVKTISSCTESETVRRVNISFRALMLSYLNDVK